MRFREAVAWGLLAAVTVGGVIVACQPAASARSVQLVYMCSAYPCQDGQLMEIRDSLGNLVAGVPEFGGPWVAGDCGLRDFGPDRARFAAGKAAYTICWESPQAYDRQFPGAKVLNCASPARWDWPGGIDVCESGQWVKKVSL